LNQISTLSQLLKDRQGIEERSKSASGLRFTSNSENEWLSYFKSLLTQSYSSAEEQIASPIRLLNSAMTWQVSTWFFYMTNQVICFSIGLQRRRALSWILKLL